MASTRSLTRRHLVRAAASVAAAATMPRSLWAATEDASPVMAKLSGYMSEAGSRPLPDQVVQQTKYHVLDTLAAMISGSELPPGRQALKFARAYAGQPIATIVASNVLGGPIEAAMVNGALAQSDETDDNYSAGGAHPGCAVVPAALALGEATGIEGVRFLRAVTLGYDIGMRAMKTVLAGTLPDTHNVVGTFGASAAAGCILNLTAQQMSWLLDYASQQAGAGYAVWQRDPQHMEKAFLFGTMGARNGVTAALLIQSGWTGVDDVFSGCDNFFQSYAPKPGPADLVDQLGERYEITQTIIKKWSTGGPIQSPLDALVNLRKQHPFEADQVKQIVVHLSTSAAPKVDNVQSPDLCLQYLFAAMLLDGTVSFRAAHDRTRMQDPTILRERAKVQVTAEEELERLLPKRVAVVEITLTDGTKLSERNDTVRGTPEDPMSQEEIVAKARDLIIPVLGSETCTKLIDKVFGLEQVKDIRELRSLLQRA
ncbi:MAG TPA: MmgE/PrpD family protein [Xanthobacteraceae bacterium]|nr:MmgE/PrpD family protein [Xanthobacteraceae bacterium]